MFSPVLMVKLKVFTKEATGPHSFSVKSTESGLILTSDVFVCWAMLKNVFRSLNAGATIKGTHLCMKLQNKLQINSVMTSFGL